MTFAESESSSKPKVGPTALLSSNKGYPVFHIPEHVQVIFVADFFCSDTLGGAELTTEAIVLSAPGLSIFKLHSSSLARELVEKNSKKIWILCNWSMAPQDALAALVTEKCEYYCIEYDYKYCVFRSSHLHQLRTGKPCDCHLKKNFAFSLYRRSNHVFFMSEGQRQEYFRLFPLLAQDSSRTSVLSSVWTSEDLDLLLQLAETNKQKNGKWAVLTGGSWIKNQSQVEAYCKSHNMQYELVGNLPYEKFLAKLAGYYGLVMHPAGFDTCPRIVVEAKLLGLCLDLNENVQHKEEYWFKTSSTNDTVEYLRTRPKIFWDTVLTKRQENGK
jgi:hypothetical protein